MITIRLRKESPLCEMLHPKVAESCSLRTRMRTRSASQLLLQEESIEMARVAHPKLTTLFDAPKTA